MHGPAARVQRRSAACREPTTIRPACTRRTPLARRKRPRPAWRRSRTGRV